MGDVSSQQLPSAGVIIKRRLVRHPSIASSKSGRALMLFSRTLDAPRPTPKQGIGTVVKSNDPNYRADWRLDNKGRESDMPKEQTFAWRGRGIAHERSREDEKWEFRGSADTNVERRCPTCTADWSSRIKSGLPSMKATQSRFLSVFRAAGVALLWLTMSVAGFQSAPAQDAASTPPGAFAGRLLAEHNRYRAAAGVPPLKWDAGLTADAEVYSRRLAVLGILVHSPRHRRNGSQGENLWRGTTGAFAPEAIVDNWGEERRWFHAGIYPDIASTHNWLDVVHYTQMTWPDSTKLGCGLSRTAQWDYLVCRYAPAGNIDGRRLP